MAAMVLVDIKSIDLWKITGMRDRTAVVYSLLRAGCNEQNSADGRAFVCSMTQVAEAPGPTPIPGASPTPAPERCIGIKLDKPVGDNGFLGFTNFQLVEGQQIEYCANVIRQASMLRFTAYDLSDRRCGSSEIRVRQIGNAGWAKVSGFSAAPGVTMVGSDLMGDPTLTAKGEYAVTLVGGHSNEGCTRFQIGWKADYVPTPVTTAEQTPSPTPTPTPTIVPTPAPTHSPAGYNRVRNGGFENSDVIGWPWLKKVDDAESNRNCTLSIVQDVKYSGRNSYRASCEIGQGNVPLVQGAGYESGYELSTNTDYEFSAMIKTNNVRDGMEVTQGAMIAIYGLEDYPSSYVALKGTHDWRPISFVFNSGTNTWVSITLRLGSQNGVGKALGTVWFDDVVIKPSTITQTPTPSGTTATMVAAGDSHNCALLATGGVKCWGSNVNGRLGDGTTTDRYTPVHVTGLATGITAVSAGGYHSCALTSTGGVKCWGSNSKGQLGDDSLTDSSIPVDVTGLSSGVSAIDTDLIHSCALLATGGVKCWGNNRTGQLGNGSTSNSSIPVDVTGLSSGVSAIGTGDSHTCAILAIGSGVKCWGRNNEGQLGDGTTTQSLTTVVVSRLYSGATNIAVGSNHSCALLATGGIKCWGDNYAGQLGNGSTSNSSTPVAVTGFSQ